METEADHIALVTAMWHSYRAAKELGMGLDHAGGARRHYRWW